MNDDHDYDTVDELPAGPRRSIAAADRALLKLAARALGAVRVEDVDGEEWVNLHFADSPVMFGWNPLQFGDDTFVLAARLDLFNSPAVQLHLVVEQSRGTDPVAGAKRAFVLAAAEIGKGMVVNVGTSERGAD
jgi:hypothetical protein